MQRRFYRGRVGLPKGRKRRRVRLSDDMARSFWPPPDTDDLLVRSMLAMPILAQLTAAAIGLEVEEEAVGARGDAGASDGHLVAIRAASPPSASTDIGGTRELAP